VRSIWEEVSIAEGQKLSATQHHMPRMDVLVWLNIGIMWNSWELNSNPSECLSHWFPVKRNQELA